MNARQRLTVVAGAAAILALAIYPPFVRETGNIALPMATTSIGHRFLWQMHSEPPVYIDYAVMYRPDFLSLASEWSLVAIPDGHRGVDLQTRGSEVGPTTSVFGRRS